MSNLQYVCHIILCRPFGAQIKPILDRFQGISGPDGSHVVGQGGGTITPAPSSSVQTSSNRFVLFVKLYQ